VDGRPRTEGERAVPDHPGRAFSSARGAPARRSEQGTKLATTTSGWNRNPFRLLAIRTAFLAVWWSKPTRGAAPRRASSTASCSRSSRPSSQARLRANDRCPASSRGSFAPSCAAGSLRMASCARTATAAASIVSSRFFSCKGRGFCPSCGGRRMADTAAHLVDRVLPEVPVRQWVLSLPFALRCRLAYDAPLVRDVLAIFVQSVFTSLRRRARKQWATLRGHGGAITFVQRFGDALNLNVHFHSLVLDGVYARSAEGTLRFHPLPPPDDAEVERVARQVARRLSRLLERRGLGDDTPEGDTLATEEPLLASLYAASVTSRVATGSRSGQRVLRVGDRIDAEDLPVLQGKRCASVGGVSVHANVAVPARDRAPVTARGRAAALSAQAPLARWHDARPIHPVGARPEARRAHPSAALPSRPVPRCARPVRERTRSHRAGGGGCTASASCPESRIRYHTGSCGGRSHVRRDRGDNRLRLDRSARFDARARFARDSAGNPAHPRQLTAEARRRQGETARVGRADETRLRERRARVSAVPGPDAHTRGDPPARHHVGDPRLPGPPGARPTARAGAPRRRLRRPSGRPIARRLRVVIRRLQTARTMRQRRSINPHPNGRPEPGASHPLAVATTLALSAVGCAPPPSFPSRWSPSVGSPGPGLT